MAIESDSSLWVERLVPVAVLSDSEAARSASEEQLQGHRAMPEGEASRPGGSQSINATISL